MKFENEALYQIRKGFWFLFHSENDLNVFKKFSGMSYCLTFRGVTHIHAEGKVDVLRRLFDIQVSYISPEVTFGILEQSFDESMENYFIKVITTCGKIGWIVSGTQPQWYFEELK
mgnify:FL=1